VESQRVLAVGHGLGLEREALAAAALTRRRASVVADEVIATPALSVASAVRSRLPRSQPSASSDPAVVAITGSCGSATVIRAPCSAMSP
jgi:hypothetical protein